MSTVTFAHDHVVRDLAARILDRLASQEPKPVAEAVRALGLAEESRLSVHEGLLLNSDAGEALAINREALALVAGQLDRPIKENPSVAAIETKDLVLITLSPAILQEAGKALETKLDKQLKAAEFTGAIAVVVFEGVDQWPEPIRLKMTTLLHRHQHPRLFTTMGIAAGATLPDALASRFLRVDVGEELTPCRKRVLSP